MQAIYPLAQFLNQLHERFSSSWSNYQIQAKSKTNPFPQDPYEMQLVLIESVLEIVTDFKLLGQIHPALFYISNYV